MSAPVDTTLPAARGKAVWALVLALIPFPLTWVAALALSIIVLTRPADGRKHGKGLAIAALVVIPLWIVIASAALLVVVAAPDGVDRDSKGAVTSSGELDFQDLRVGDCVIDLPETTSYGLKVVPCGQPHIYEVFGSFALPDTPYPGDDAVDTLSSDGCTQRFGDYVGMGYEDSILDMQYFTPFEETWDDDHGTLCVLYREGVPTRGSYAGSAR